MPNKPILYGPAYSTYTRTTRLALAEKAIAYELVNVDFLRGGAKTTSHRNRHPFGKVPVFEHDGFLIFETGAILQYLEDAFDGPPLIPEDAREKAKMHQISSAICSYIYPPVVGTIIVQRLVMPVLGIDADENAIEKAIPKARKALGVIDKFVADNRYLAGPRISYADVYLAPMYDYFAQTPEGRDVLSEFRNLARWWNEMADRQSVVDTQTYDI